MKIAGLLLGTLLLVAPLAGMAHADDVRPIQDDVVLTLEVEDWVQTESATVHVAVDAAFDGADSDTVRARVLEMLDKIATAATWRITNFQQSRDQAGLERWQVVAEGRLSQAQLGGLYDKARDASAPGLQAAIRYVDFTPTLAERQATIAKLRAEIYRQVSEELNNLKQIYPGRPFRVHRIDFVGTGIETDAMFDQRPRPTMRAESKSAMAPGDAVAVSAKAKLSATIILSSTP